MVSIFLHRRELAGGRNLPNVCVVCGRRGQLTDVTLRQRSGHLFSLGGGDVYNQDAVLPLCSAHRNYFNRGSLLPIVFAILAMLFLTAAGCLFAFGPMPYALSSFLLFVFSAILCQVNVLVVSRRTRASTIEDRGLRLASVSKDFVEALDELREAKRPGRVREEERFRHIPERSGTVVWAALLGGLLLGVLLASGGVAGWFLWKGTNGALGTALGGVPLDGQGGVPGGGPPVPQGGAPGAGTPGAPDPRRPTVPSRVTVENFHKLKVDMTATEVRDILGPHSSTVNFIIEGTCWKDGSNRITVFFSNDLLVAAEADISGRGYKLGLDLGIK